jgi:uncharacterized protein
VTGAAGSALYLGRVRHRRAGSPARAFTYPVWQVLVDLDEVSELSARIPFLSLNRFNLVSFDDRDHLRPVRRPVREKLDRWLLEQGAEPARGPVRLLTTLRTLGAVFNPVSFFFCHKPDGGLRWVVAEVNNTFGETACYLLPGADVGVVRHEVAKTFHVSPFQPVSGCYRFRVTPPGERLTVHIDLMRDGERVFDATLSARRRPLDARNLAAAIARDPLGPLRTLVLIHWQALRLVARRAKLFRKPDLPSHAWRTRHG